MCISQYQEWNHGRQVFIATVRIIIDKECLWVWAPSLVVVLVGVGMDLRISVSNIHPLEVAQNVMRALSK